MTHLLTPQRLRLLSAGVATACLTLCLVACTGSDTADTATPRVPSTDVAVLTPEAEALSERSGARIMLRVNKAMRSARSFHVEGFQADPTGRPIEVDLSMDRAGACLGTIRLGEGRLRVRALDHDRGWYQADRAFYIRQLGTRQGNATADAVGTRWVRVTPEDSVLAVCDLAALVDGLDLAGAADYSRGEVDVATPSVTVVGTRVATGFRSDPSMGNTQTDTVVVSLEAPYYVLSGRSVNGDQVLGETTFSGYGRPVEVSAPPAARIVTL